jgi:putative transposase
MAGAFAMKQNRVTHEQIILAAEEHEAGTPVADLCRRLGISQPTFSRWKTRFSGMDVADAKRLRALEAENAKLKHLLADALLDNKALKDVLAKKW